MQGPGCHTSLANAGVQLRPSQAKSVKHDVNLIERRAIKASGTDESTVIAG